MMVTPDATPKRVEYGEWGEDGYAIRDSDRLYIETTGMEYRDEIGDYYREPVTRYTDVFLDPLTGLVVFDVKAYEKWIQRWV